MGDIFHEQRSPLERLQEGYNARDVSEMITALWQLDQVLTRREPDLRVYYTTVTTAIQQQWGKTDVGSIVVYLADGGISRLIVNWENGQLTVTATDHSASEVIERLEQLRTGTV